jgi:hypothetical protein
MSDVTFDRDVLAWEVQNCRKALDATIVLHNAAEARVETLEKIIEDAPHSGNCATRCANPQLRTKRGMGRASICDCFKSKATASTQREYVPHESRTIPAPPPEMAPNEPPALTCRAPDRSMLSDHGPVD